MEKISEIIKRLCPEGVGKVRLGQIIEYEQPSKYIVKNTDYKESGIPVLTAGQSFILGYTDELTGIFHATKSKPTIIFDDFTTSFHWVDFDFKVKSSAMKMLNVTRNDVSFRYVYYAMREIVYEPVEHSRQWISQYSNFEIPLPPLSIQQEIVRVLDSFTAMITNLETELASRQKQYEHYRNQLLTFDENDNLKKIGVLSKMIKRLCPEGVEKVRLDSVCSFTRGNTITAKNAIEGTIPVIAGGQTPSYYHNEANRIGDTVVIAGSGAYAGFVSYWQIPIYVSDAFSIDSKESLHKKYLFYFLKRNQRKIYETQKGAGVPHVHGKDIAGFEIPLPPLSVQQEIISILDTFELLITNIKLEREARKKQYEYYREILLTFE